MEEIDEHYGIAAALSNIGNVYRSKGERTKALEYYGQGLEIFQKLGDKWSIAGMLNNIGTVYYYKGDLVRALEYYGQSFEMRQKLGDKSGIALSLNNIGNLSVNDCLSHLYFLFNQAGYGDRSKQPGYRPPSCPG